MNNAILRTILMLSFTLTASTAQAEETMKRLWPLCNGMGGLGKADTVADMECMTIASRLRDRFSTAFRRQLGTTITRTIW